MIYEKLKEFLNEEPWWIIDERMADILNKELTKELSHKHLLYGKKATAVARREDCDDVVFWISELDKYAVVHLTWTKETTNQFPITKLYSLTELAEHCMNVTKFL